MSLNELTDQIVREFKADPRNKVYATEELLLASVLDESGKKINSKQLHAIIGANEAGEITEKQQETYDAAVCVCGQLARLCFGNNEEEDVDYDLSWIENNDGSYSAEIRPS